MDLDKEIQRMENQLSQVPARRELIEQRTGEQVQLAHALETALIRDSEDKPIKQALNYAMVKLGLRAENWPAKEESYVLLGHIRKEYGGHTLAEIRLAWDMALGGKLNLEAKQIPCYQDFSCEYFSRIMNAYRKWAAEEVRQLKVIPPEPEVKENMNDLTMKEWFEDVRKNVRAGGYKVEFIPKMLCEWAESEGKLGYSLDEYLVRAMERVFDQLVEANREGQTIESRMELKEFAAMRRAGEFTGKYVESLPVLAKKMMLYDLMLIDHEH